jgi:serine/threonine protein kinase
MSTSSEPQQVIGRYALFGPLAAGGMATVHLGRLIGPVGFSRTVAIKRLHEQFASDPEFVSGFLDEARLAARIRHPNVVPTLDVVATGGQLFLVMEYVQGESLSRLLKLLRPRGGQVPLAMAVSIVASVLHGLHAAHEATSEKGEPLHIVHRDVSPHNILVGLDGVPRVLDFGVAKATGRLLKTQSGRVKGKIAYMAPEQLRGQPLDRRTDVFAASIVLWECLTGLRLFSGENEGEVLEHVLFAPIEPPSCHRREVQPMLDQIVMRGLSREIGARWQTARDMALALEASMPLPTPAQIGAWVELTAHDLLAERAGLVAEMESATSQAGDRVRELLSEVRATAGAPTRQFPLGKPKPDSESATRSAAISMSSPAAQPKKSGAWIWALLVALGGVILATVGITLTLSHHRQDQPTPTPAPSPVVATAQPPNQIEPLIDSSEQTPSVAPSSLPLEPTPRATQVPRKKTTPPVTSAHPKAPPPGVDCTVPFTRDELGRKIWKKECLSE